MNEENRGEETPERNGSENGDAQSVSPEPEKSDSNGSASNTTKRFHLSLFARLRAYFLAGVLVTAPIAITIAMAKWVIEFVDAKIVPLIPDYLNPDTYLSQAFGVQFGLPGLGLIILIVSITLIGAFTAGLMGRWLVRIGEAILNKMPIVRTIYGGSKQIIETVLKSQSQAFRQAVLIEYPRPGLWAIAFITSETEGEVQRKTEDRVVNVFLPTTPNPTSGFLLFVPKSDMIYLDMTVEDAIKMVISAGIVTPPERPGRAAPPGTRIPPSTVRQNAIEAKEAEAAGDGEKQNGV